MQNTSKNIINRWKNVKNLTQDKVTEEKNETPPGLAKVINLSREKGESHFCVIFRLQDTTVAVGVRFSSKLP